MKALKGLGISDLLISAMLDSTARAIEKEEAASQKAEMEKLVQEQKRLQEEMARQKAGAAQATPAAAQGSTLGDCAAQLGAIQLCQNIPGGALVQMACEMAAKSKFPCK